MVTINRVYTRTGDDGTTGLVGGSRIKKNSLRVHAYGEIDELNSWIGWCRTAAAELASNNNSPAAAGAPSGFQRMATTLEVVQHRLFDIGAELACPRGELLPGMVAFSDSHSTVLEQEIDAALEGLAALKSFVLPGGTTLNSALHVARTVCRRAERAVLALADEEPVSSSIVVYLNRLSDFLFSLARRASADQGIAEYLWAQKK